MKTQMKAAQIAFQLASSALVAAGCASPSKAVSRDPALTSDSRVLAYESGPEGFNTKNFFYDNGEEVVVFDTQFTPELARQSIEFIKAKTSSPITTVVITHPNPDKFNGASEFQKLGAKVISSSATANAIPGTHAYKKYFFVNLAKMFTEQTYPVQATVDETFDGQMDLKLRNGEVIKLRELSQPGVSSTQTVAWIERSGALIVGDLVHHKAHAWLEGGIVGGKATPTVRQWIADLKELTSRYPSNAIVYGGRGEAAALSTVVSAQIEYLRKADAIVSRYVASTPKAELSGAKAQEHYKNLQSLFETEFPGYGLGYMIQYGVYGLVDSKLR